MRERRVAHVVKEGGQTNPLPLLRGQLRGEGIGYNAGKVHRTQHMFEPRMVRGGVDILRPRQLPYPTQPLNRKRIDNIPLNLGKPNVTVDRILNETPIILCPTQLETATKR